MPQPLVFTRRPLAPFANWAGHSLFAPAHPRRSQRNVARRAAIEPPPSDYNHREALLEASLSTVAERHPELVDLVQKGGWAARL